MKAVQARAMMHLGKPRDEMLHKKHPVLPDGRKLALGSFA